MDPSIPKSSILKTLDSLFATLNSPGSGEIKAAFADTSEWTSDGVNSGGPLQGAAVAAMLDKLRSSFGTFIIGIPDLRHPPGAAPELHGTGIPSAAVVFEEGRALCTFEVYATDAMELPGIGKTGRNINFRGTADFQFDGHAQIVMLRTTWNCARVMAQLGLRSYARPGAIPQ